MIKITPSAWAMLMLAARYDDTLEVGGFFRFAIGDDGDITVDDVLIPPQEVRATHVDIDSDQLDWLMVKLIERGEHGRQYGWWHSHNTMSATPSDIDHETLLKLAMQANDGFALGIVVNVRGEASGFAYYQSPITGRYLEEKIPVSVIEEVDPALVAYVEEQMKHVTKAKPTTTWSNNAIIPYRGNAQGQQDDDIDDEAEAAWYTWIEGCKWDDLTPREQALIRTRPKLLNSSFEDW